MRVSVAGAVLLLTPAAASASPPGEVSADALQARVAELEATVVRLRAEESQEQWLTEQRADEIRGLVQDVVADADTRASLLQDGMMGGWDDGFVLASADGNFKLKISGQLQFRYVWNDQNNSPEDDNRWGFENRRTKIKFTGHAVDPSWKYQVSGAFIDDGGEFLLEDANITKDLGDGWALKFGQFKPPFLREALVSSSRQLAVERSLVNAESNQRRAQGVEIQYKGDQLAFKAMYHDGFGTSNTRALAEDTEFAVDGRVEWLAAGEWGQFKEFTSWEGEAFAFLLGVAIHYENEEYGTPAGPEQETFTWTIDGSLKFGGAHAFAAIVGQHLDVADADQYGIVVQGGYFFVPDEWEAFVRYEYGDLDLAGQSHLNVITVGVNRYFAKHALKWTTDVGFALDEISSDWATRSSGWREDSPGEDGQVVLRSQLQLLF